MASYGSSGVAVAATSSSCDTIFDFAVDSKGRALVLARCKSSMHLIRLGADGKVDTSFGGATGLEVEATRIAVDVNDRIVAAYEDKTHKLVVTRYVP